MTKHKLQEAIIGLIKREDISEYGYRTLAQKIGITHPQTAKYHLSKLLKDGLIKMTPSGGYEVVKESVARASSCVNLPILGYANCGEPLMFTGGTRSGEELTISRSLLPATKSANNYFVVQAKGDSMNKARINGQPIDDGDYILVDGNKNEPSNNSYSLVSVDGLATIKKLKIDWDQQIISLNSESTRPRPPIIIDAEASGNLVCHGQIAKVIKLS